MNFGSDEDLDRHVEQVLSSWKQADVQTRRPSDAGSDAHMRERSRSPAMSIPDSPSHADASDVNRPGQAPGGTLDEEALEDLRRAIVAEHEAVISNLPETLPHRQPITATNYKACVRAFFRFLESLNPPMRWSAVEPGPDDKDAQLALAQLIHDAVHYAGYQQEIHPALIAFFGVKIAHRSLVFHDPERAAQQVERKKAETAAKEAARAAKAKGTRKGKEKAIEVRPSAERGTSTTELTPEQEEHRALIAKLPALLEKKVSPRTKQPLSRQTQLTYINAITNFFRHLEELPPMEFEPLPAEPVRLSWSSIAPEPAEDSTLLSVLVQDAIAFHGLAENLSSALEFVYEVKLIGPSALMASGLWRGYARPLAPALQAEIEGLAADFDPVVAMREHQEALDDIGPHVSGNYSLTISRFFAFLTTQNLRWSVVRPAPGAESALLEALAGMAVNEAGVNRELRAALRAAFAVDVGAIPHGWQWMPDEP
jgi:hypothetical protein